MILIQKKKPFAAESFKNDFFKLMKIVYVKIIENLRKTINVRLIIGAKDYKKYASKPSLFSQKILLKKN